MIGQPPVPVHDPEDVRRLADEILARREFAPPERSFLHRAVDWILRQLERLFGGGDGDAPGVGGESVGGAGGSAWFTLLLLVLAAVLVVVVLRALSGTWTGRRRKEDDPLDIDVDERRDAAAWDDLARRLEAEGRWKDAMRARFGSLVERLAEVGVVADVPGRTSGEYRVDVRGTLPAAADDFARASELFERAWYGDLPTGPDEAERFADGAGRVLEAAGARR